MYSSFEDLRVWKAGCDIAVRVYDAFRASKDFGLKDQIQRSSVSIASNIAEGAERGSDKDFVRFLHHAKGSSAEMRTQAIIARRVGEISDADCEEIQSAGKQVSRQLQALIRSLEKQG